MERLRNARLAELIASQSRVGLLEPRVAVRGFELPLDEGRSPALNTSSALPTRSWFVSAIDHSWLNCDSHWRKSARMLSKVGGSPKNICCIFA